MLKSTVLSGPNAQIDGLSRRGGAIAPARVGGAGREGSPDVSGASARVSGARRGRAGLGGATKAVPRRRRVRDGPRGPRASHALREPRPCARGRAGLAKGGRRGPGRRRGAGTALSPELDRLSRLDVVKSGSFFGGHDWDAGRPRESFGADVGGLWVCG